jgi:copper chaperone CopZ
MTDTLQITVMAEQELHCAGRKERSRPALRRLRGVQEVQASAQTQQVTVAIDPGRVGPDRVWPKLEPPGYQLTP